MSKASSSQSARRRLFPLLLAGITCLSPLGAVTSARSEPDPRKVALANYAEALKTHVSEAGKVDYGALKKNPQKLGNYLDWVAKLTKDQYRAWDQDEKIAFWINAYNGYTLKLILDHYPIRATGADGPKNSIRQIPGNWDEIRFEVMGKKMTLNDIEHETLRKHFDQPGIHVALVCAAVGCPILRQEPFEGDRLEEQLADQARRYFATPYGLKVDRRQNKLYLSSIYDWFKKDFVKTYGKSAPGNGSDLGSYSPENAAVLRYLLLHVPEKTRDFVKSKSPKIAYLDYDWNLNEQS